MSILAAVQNIDEDINIKGEVDSVGSSGPVESGLYPATVALAYMNKSAGGALACVVHLKLEDGREVRQSLWVASGDAKGNLPYFTDKSGEKKYLPGYNVANSLCLLTLGKELGEMDDEEKVINLYSFDVSKEVPTKVPVLTELLGQEVIVGIIKQVVDKNAKGDDGAYHPTGDTRTENEIDKVFRAKDNMTTAEIIGGAEEATFIETWRAKWEGKVKDKSTADSSGSNPFQGKAANDGNTTKPTKSLFNPK